MASPSRRAVVPANRDPSVPSPPAIPVFKPFLTGGHGDRGLSVTLKVAAIRVFKPDPGWSRRFPFWSRKARAIRGPINAQTHGWDLACDQQEDAVADRRLRLPEPYRRPRPPAIPVLKPNCVEGAT